MKAKYFEDMDILNAKPVAGMSYVWRSIEVAGSNKQGIIWRIGDGANVQIWQTNGSPNGDTRHPRTRQSSGDEGPGAY
jgi:hypothetical protein